MNPIEALDSLRGVEGAYVEQYPTHSAAAVAWRQAINDQLIVALRIPVEPPLIHEANQTLSFLGVSESSVPCNESISGNESIPCNESILWHRAAHVSGPKWVVWKGRVPGIYDSW